MRFRVSSDSTGRACRLSQLNSEDTDFPLCHARSLPSAILTNLHKHFFGAGISALRSQHMPSAPGLWGGRNLLHFSGYGETGRRTSCRKKNGSPDRRWRPSCTDSCTHSRTCPTGASHSTRGGNQSVKSDSWNSGKSNFKRPKTLELRIESFFLVDTPTSRRDRVCTNSCSKNNSLSIFA